MNRVSMVVGLAVLCGVSAGAFAQPYDLSWYTVDGGGGTSAGGAFSLSGTIGQHDAGGPMTGGVYSLTGGFWAGAVVTPPCPCAADFDGSGGTPDTTDITSFFQTWLTGDPAADVDCSGGTPDLTDITQFFVEWLAGGC